MEYIAIYMELFGDCVPAHELGLCTPEEIEKVAQKCVEEGQDAYTLFHLELSDEKY